MKRSPIKVAEVDSDVKKGHRVKVVHDGITFMGERFEGWTVVRVPVVSGQPCLSGVIKRMTAEEKKDWL